MQVKVVLENPTGKYTNLDPVRGVVLLRVFQPSKISHVLVKLEGECRTRLQAQDPNKSRPDQFMEIHKLLYKVQRVFPPPEVAFDIRTKQSFSLAPGSYEYPFHFKIPFNNACLSNMEAHGPSNPFNISGFNAEMSRASTHHVRTTLPPTMHQNLEAGIRYFVKATVNVPSMFKENPRALVYFSFDPIEPPRTKKDGEAYARRQHQFNDGPLNKQKRSFSFKSGFKSDVPLSPTTGPQLARFGIDVRLPNPPVLTCGQEVPVRVLFKQLSSRTQPLFLQTFQIELIGYTKLRAQGISHQLATSWVLTSVSSLNYPIGDIQDPEGKETELSKEFSFGHPLPDAVCPSFVTCNIERYYELVVSIGLAYGSTTPGQDQFYLLPLRHRVQVFSGIRPPDELLQRMADQPASPPVQTSALPTYSSGPSRPTASNPAGPHPEDMEFDPPPSYEDAMAENIQPIQGPRPGYNPQPAQSGAQGGLFDEKS